MHSHFSPFVHPISKAIHAAAACFLLSTIGCCPGSSAGDSPTSLGTPSDTNASGDKTAAHAAPGKTPSGFVPPSDLEYTESKLHVDTAAGDPKTDAFNFFRVWGEVRNKSGSWVERIEGDIRYYGADGKELGIDSIRTGVKRDLGDDSPGETIRSDVTYIPPGGVVPLHHIRSLNKLKGTYASYKITFRPSRIATSYPDVSLESLKDEVANVANPALPNSTPKDHRVVSATLRNKGTAACRNPGIIVGYYQNGKLSDLAQSGIRAASDLDPGNTTNLQVFSLVGFDEAWRSTATVKTWARCDP